MIGDLERHRQKESASREYVEVIALYTTMEGLFSLSNPGREGGIMYALVWSTRRECFSFEASCLGLVSLWD